MKRTLRLPAGTLRARDGGPGPRERHGRRPPDELRGARCRPRASLGIRRDRARGRCRRPPRPRSTTRCARRVRATPLLGRSFRGGHADRLAAAEPAPGRPRVRPEVELEFRRDGQAGRARDARAAARRPRRPHHLRRQLPDGRLGAGRYEVWVRGRQGDVEATEATAFTITARASAGGRRDRGRRRRAAVAFRRRDGCRLDRGQEGRRRRRSRRSSSGPAATCWSTRRRSATSSPRRRYRQWGLDPTTTGRHDRPHAALGSRVRPPDGASAVGHVPRRLRGGRAEGARPGAAAREALLRPEAVGLRAGAGDPRRELALQPRPRLPQRERADARPPLPASREPATARVQAEGDALDRRLPDGRGRVRGEESPSLVHDRVETTCRRAGGSGSTRPAAPSCAPRSSTTSRRRRAPRPPTRGSGARLRPSTAARSRSGASCPTR